MDELRQSVECKRGARTVVLLQTHYLNRALLRMFRELSRAMPETTAIVLMHLPPDQSKPRELARLPHHFVTTPEIREPAYVRKSNGPGWAIWRGGHVDLIALHFFKMHPDYAYYWFIEYDVRFSGEWRTFFTAFQDSDADLLSTSIRRASNDPKWMYWPSLHPPAGVGSLTADEMLCGFMPIYRISHRGLISIDQAYRDGWTGHCEAVWPTVLHRSGYRLEDIGGDGEFVRPGNINRFYTNNPSDPELKPGSLVFRPVRWMTGSSRDRLWHPVKPLPHKLREDARHVWVSLKPYLPWVRPAVSLPSLSQRPCGEEANRDPSSQSPSLGAATRCPVSHRQTDSHRRSRAGMAHPSDTEPRNRLAASESHVRNLPECTARLHHARQAGTTASANSLADSDGDRRPHRG